MKIPVETNIHENLNNTTNNSISFSSWLSKSHPSTDELRNIFINMDLAMKYIHGKGFCIKSFDPKDIKILNNDINEIKYDTVLRMPNDYNDQQELIREDIYSSAFLANTKDKFNFSCIPFDNSVTFIFLSKFINFNKSSNFSSSKSS